MARNDFLAANLKRGRMYTNMILDEVRPEDWFRLPAPGTTHVAWQVGHMASAQYHLCLKRLRGARPEDKDFLSDDFAALFGRGSSPDPDQGKYPSVEEIRRVFQSVYEHALEELAGVDDKLLDEVTEPPHPMFTTKFEAIHFCPQHEALHTGQISLLRRFFGQPPKV